MHQVKIYTREGALMCKVFSRQCVNSSCLLVYSGEEDCIFFNKQSSGVAVEVLWDFVEAVRRTKVSFTAFCNEMSNKYSSCHPMATRFMSRQTFIDVFFAWIVSFDLDFRAEIDPWCGHNPRKLAADGTHIGVSVKLANYTPINEPETGEVKQPRHKRFQRVFMPSPMAEPGKRLPQGHTTHSEIQQARKYLKNNCLNLFQKGVPVADEDELLERALFDRVIMSYGKHELTDFCRAFLNRELHADVTTAAAKLLILMLGDGALSAVFPCRFHWLFTETFAALLAGQPISKNLREMQKCAVEVADLLFAAKQHAQETVCVHFLRRLVEQVDELHQGDSNPSADPIAGTFDPTSGRCYYFTEHGCQLRKLPKYNVSGEGRTYDTKPSLDEPCEKNYPQVSYGGFGYMMFMFCPTHGHCYGFHLISGGEGRKDPFAALFMYMESPPTDFFYDFACQMSEYCLNREPGFFKWVRFWHDLFHSILHKCGFCFKSSRVCGMEGLNTEICEQFNSYLQCIKYTGSHLRQNLFVLMVQFFLYLYNKDKTAAYKKMAKVAIAGTL